LAWAARGRRLIQTDTAGFLLWRKETEVVEGGRGREGRGALGARVTEAQASR